MVDGGGRRPQSEWTRCSLLPPHDVSTTSYASYSMSHRDNNDEERALRQRIKTTPSARCWSLLLDSSSSTTTTTPARSLPAVDAPAPLPSSTPSDAAVVQVHHATNTNEHGEATLAHEDLVATAPQLSLPHIYPRPIACEGSSSFRSRTGILRADPVQARGTRTTARKSGVRSGCRQRSRRKRKGLRAPRISLQHRARRRAPPRAGSKDIRHIRRDVEFQRGDR